MEKNNSKYAKAKKHVKELKGWYVHLAIYLVCCAAYILFNLGIFDGGRLSGNLPWWAPFTMPLGWGIGLTCHWIYVHKDNWINNRFKWWEEHKIKEYLQREESQSKKYTQWD